MSVNRNGFHIRLVYLVVAVLSVALIAPISAAQGNNATEANNNEEDSQRLDAGRYWREGVELALGGDFASALEEVRKAAEIDPDDEYIAAGEAELDKYVSQWDRFERERKEQYDEATKSVRRAMLAQSYRPELLEAELAEPLRERTEEGIFEPYNSVDGASMLNELSEDSAEELKERIIEATEKMSAGVDRTVSLLNDDDSEYAEEFREVAEQVSHYIRVYRNGWEGVRLDDERQRSMAEDVLTEIEDKLTDAMASLEMMADEKPWRSALSKGIQARELHREENGELTAQDWYKELTALGEERAAKAVEEAEWYDAAAAYSGLEELTGETGEYEQQVREARRHVRVLGLYGDGDDDDNPSQRSGNRSWEELVEGADAEMVRQAIQHLDHYYVTSVNHRELAEGALMAIRVLAETPQATASFDSLADEDNRDKFVAALESLQRNLVRKDHFESWDLLVLLNMVLRESQRTVDLPPEVVSVEFADGMLNELDRFSSMIWPHDVADFERHTRGHFFGVGIQITKDIGEPLEVVTPLPGTPAYNAGIRPGDVILEVDGRRTEDQNIDSLVRSIMGEEGTKVVLTIERPGRAQPFDVELIREKITIQTVKGWRRQEDGEYDYLMDTDKGVGYIRCSQFSEQTREELSEALEHLSGKELNALVLDLRWNAGGLLGAAVEFADEFLSQNRRIVSTQGRQVRSEERSASSDGLYLNGPLVVLVNDASASAAEIVSGALQDWDRAIVVGQRTYGKGSVQNVIRLRQNRAMLKLTTAYYYLPHGRLLHRANGDDEWGVDPDIGVRMTPQQVRRWLEIRRQTDLVHEVDPQELTRNLQKKYESDLQLQTAVVLLKLMQLDEARSAA